MRKTKLLVLLVLFFQGPILLAQNIFPTAEVAEQQFKLPVEVSDVDSNSVLFSKLTPTFDIKVREYCIFLNAVAAKKESNVLYDPIMEDQILKTDQQSFYQYLSVDGRDNDFMLHLTELDAVIFFRWVDNGCQIGWSDTLITPETESYFLKEEELANNQGIKHRFFCERPNSECVITTTRPNNGKTSMLPEQATLPLMMFRGKKPEEKDASNPFRTNQKNSRYEYQYLSEKKESKQNQIDHKQDSTEKKSLISYNKKALTNLSTAAVLRGATLAMNVLAGKRNFTMTKQIDKIMTMRAIQIKKPGPPEALQLVKMAQPSANYGEVVIKNELIGLNYVDTYYRNGSYAAQKLPLVPGMEGVGTIIETGAGVQNVTKGSRVAYAMQLGAYAEFTVVPINRVYCLPEEISSECAIVHFLQGMTATFLSNMLTKTEIDSTSTILFRGAGCGVGKMLLPLLRQKNIHVLATTRSTEKVENLMQSGGKEVIVDNGDAEELCKIIQKSVKTSGIPVIYDSIGGSETWKFLPCMKSRGLYVLFGQSAGAAAPIDPQSLRQNGSLFVTRPSLTHYMNSFEETKLLGDELFRNIYSMGNLNEIDTIFGLEDAVKAHHYLEQRKSLGKVILKP